MKLCREMRWNPKNELNRHEAFEKDPEKQIRHKYGIAFLEDPKKKIPLEKIGKNPFWSVLKNRGIKGPNWPSIQNPLYPKGEPVIRSYEASFEDKMQAPLTLVINLVYSKAEIMARVKRLVNEAFDDRKKRGLEVYGSRKRFKLYDRYLASWDMKEGGLTYRQIAAKLFPHISQSIII